MEMGRLWDLKANRGVYKEREGV